MPGLNGGFAVLEHDFNKIVQRGADNPGPGNCRGGWRGVFCGVQGEDAWDIEIISQLQWGIWIHVRHLVDCISSLPIDLSNTVF